MDIDSTHSIHTSDDLCFASFVQRHRVITETNCFTSVKNPLDGTLHEYKTLFVIFGTVILDEPPGGGHPLHGRVEGMLDNQLVVAIERDRLLVSGVGRAGALHWLRRGLGTVR